MKIVISQFSELLLR